MYWSKNKENKFVKLYKTNSDEDVAKIMKLPFSFVQRKAEELGLEKEDVEHNEWKQEEISYLLATYQNNSNEKLSHALGRTKSQIEHRAYQLGIRKSREYMNSVVKEDNDDFVSKWANEWNKSMNCSRGHYVLRHIIQHLFPYFRVVEEMPIGNLRIDIAVPQLQIACEFHGIQHEHYNSFFHSTKNDFVKGQENDWSKSEMLENMGYSLLVVYHDEELSINLIKQKLEEIL